MEIDLTSAVGHLLYHNLTYSDLNITRRVTEDYNLEYIASDEAHKSKGHCFSRCRRDQSRGDFTRLAPPYRFQLCSHCFRENPKFVINFRRFPTRRAIVHLHFVGMVYWTTLANFSHFTKASDLLYSRGSEVMSHLGLYPIHSTLPHRFI
jgi:hypothetical protein